MIPKNYHFNFSIKSLALTCATISVLLAGCDGDSSSDDDDDGHTDTEIDTAGRLVLYDQDNTAIKVMDLDSEAVLDTFSLPGDSPRLYASPELRYAVVIQRSDDLVSFVDSGIYTEDHGDHLHEYANDPMMLSYSLSGNMPTHYTAHEDFAAVFFDALDDGMTSSVTLLTDESIGAGEAVTELALDNNMHGVAKLIEDKLFVTHRDPLITGTNLPAAVDRYSFDDGEFTFEHRYTEECPKLHGSAATDDFVTFGCGDGVLAIDLSDASYPATKLGNPDSLLEDNRIRSLYSHHEVAEFVGVAGDQFYVIDPSQPADPYRELSLPDGVSRSAQGFDGHGEVFYILGDDGKLYLFSVESDWGAIDPINVADEVGDDDISPAVTISRAEDKLFILNTNGQKIFEVDSTSGEILRTINLDFTATRLVWLGLTEHHDHNH